MHEFPCPHCSVPLRIRDDSYRNRTIDCPDCRQPLVIREADGRLSGAAAEAPKPAVPEVTPPRVNSRLPKIAASVVAGALLLALAGYSLRNDKTPADVPDVPAPPPQADVPPAAPPAPEEVPEPPVGAPQRLAQIRDLLDGYVQARGTYPGSNSVPHNTERSWIAELAEEQLPKVRVDWSRGWSAPGNDEFVRRRFPTFDNPEIAAKAGEDHFPATHFVGISGVGADADRLPKTHPRTGVFGQGRQTSPADITDGLTNTMIVAGVNAQLGSWARTGRATVRSFDHEPYVNGPDGFGTGQRDGMYVLMADGSVRFLSGQTDPVIVRRMAAMADGLTLDPSVPGDPLTMQVPAPAVEPGTAQRPDPPLLVELTPDPPRFRFHQALQQRIAAFEQPKPTPFEDLLFDLQELSGAPFDLSQLSPEMLKRPLTLSAQNATVLEILRQLSESAGANCDVMPDRIVISPAASAALKP